MKIPFPKKTLAKALALRALDLLEQTYPDAQTALRFGNPFELIVSVILSAQCTDARVNMTTPALFAKYPTPRALGEAKQEDVERIVKSCGFFRTKARNIIACAAQLAQKYGGKVPNDREALEALPGVGRKTASVVMSVAFEEAAIAVDTHVFRVSHRLGLTIGKTPEDVERDLQRLVPRSKWRHAHHWLILHGRAVCKAPTPRCGVCPVQHLCPTPKLVARSLGARSGRGEAAGEARRPAKSASAAKKA